MAKHPEAVITGASSGLGTAFARRLAADGYDVTLVARRRDRLTELAKELQSTNDIIATVLPTDLTTDGGVQIVADHLRNAKQLALLVNNAGFGTTGRFFEVPLETSLAMHDLQVRAVLRLTHAALASMAEREGGAIVNVSSISAFSQMVGATSYVATKAWLNAFTANLDLELRSSGSPIRVQALCPGFIRTEFHATLGSGRPPVGDGWWMEPADVVDASLRGLKANRWCVVPGWRYKLLTALTKRAPESLLRWMANRATRNWKRA